MATSCVPDCQANVAPCARYVVNTLSTLATKIRSASGEIAVNSS